MLFAPGIPRARRKSYHYNPDFIVHTRRPSFRRVSLFVGNYAGDTGFDKLSHRVA